MRIGERGTPRLLALTEILPASAILTNKTKNDDPISAVNTVMTESLLLFRAIESGDATKRKFAVNCTPALDSPDAEPPRRRLFLTGR
jgi:hypothetical protein